MNSENPPVNRAKDFARSSPSDRLVVGVLPGVLLIRAVAKLVRYTLRQALRDYIIPVLVDVRSRILIKRQVAQSTPEHRADQDVSVAVVKYKASVPFYGDPKIISSSAGRLTEKSCKPSPKRVAATGRRAADTPISMTDSMTITTVSWATMTIVAVAFLYAVSWLGGNAQPLSH